MAATIGTMVLGAGVVVTLTSLAAASENTCSTVSPAKANGLMQLHAHAAIPEMSQFGNPKCPCVGLSNISGTTVVVHGTRKIQYPADVGAHCAAWDHWQEPCEKGASCAQQWCFVDPCNCELDFMPKASVYLPDGQYQGKPMYYSYHTCRGKQTWGHEQYGPKGVDKIDSVWGSMCDKKLFDSPDWGKDGCKCVGIDGLTGSTNVTIWDKQVSFPADAGSSCKVWDLENNPLCSGDNLEEVPAWCTKRWCLVDPCSCSLAVPPTRSTYLPHASIAGKSIYYSYETCNEQDLWTHQHNTYACVNQETEKACLKFERCGWDMIKKQCLGREPLHECNVATARIAMEVADEASHLDAKAKKSMTLARAKAEAAQKSEHRAEKDAEYSEMIRNATEANASKEKHAAARAVERSEEAKAFESVAAIKSANASTSAKLAEQKEKAAHEAAEAKKALAARADEKLKQAKATAESAWEAAQEKAARANRSMQVAAEARAVEHAASAAVAEQKSKTAKAAEELEAAQATEKAAAKYAAKKAAIAAAAEKAAEDAAARPQVFHEYGKSECPCIGIDNRTGFTAVVLNETTKMDYPADVGAHCAAWDDGLEALSCKEGQNPGRGKGWCAERWCFVDPCNCNMHIKPQASTYLPDGQYQGKPLYFSYHTCRGHEKPAREVKAEVSEDLCEKKADSAYQGKDECKCIGIDGLTGTTNFTVGSEQVQFPAEAGANCEAWDLDSNPMCSGSHKEVPAWCTRRWCFVDPCECSLVSPPSRSRYIPFASVDGKAVYYSYETCSNDDLWTAEKDNHACVNRKTETHCLTSETCGWDTVTKTCLGKEPLHDCKHPKVSNEAKTAPETNQSFGNTAAHEAHDQRSLAAAAVPTVSLILMLVTQG